MRKGPTCSRTWFGQNPPITPPSPVPRSGLIVSLNHRARGHCPLASSNLAPKEKVIGNSAATELLKFPENRKFEPARPVPLRARPRQASSLQRRRGFERNMSSSGRANPRTAGRATSTAHLGGLRFRRGTSKRFAGHLFGCLDPRSHATGEGRGVERRRRITRLEAGVSNPVTYGQFGHRVCGFSVWLSTLRPPSSTIQSRRRTAAGDRTNTRGKANRRRSRTVPACLVSDDSHRTESGGAAFHDTSTQPAPRQFRRLLRLSGNE